MAKDFSLLVKVCDKISKYSIFVLIAVFPILFLPWTSDVLDFNKQALIVLLLFVSVFSWMIKVLVSGSFKTNLSKANIAVLVLFLVSLVSTIFSKDQQGSFWGWPKVVSESLLTTICFALFYLLVSNIFSKKEILNAITVFVVSSSISILAGCLQLLGLSVIPFDFAKNAYFNTVGSVSSFGFFIASLLPLLIILEIFAEKKWLKLTIIAAIVLSAIALVFINYYAVWWIVLTGSAFVLIFGMLKRDFFDLRWLGLAMFFFVLSLFFLVLNPQISAPQRPVEIYLNQKTTFDIVLKTLKESPIFGSGPATFINDFSQYRSVDFNQGQFWNLRFDGGASKFLTFAATNGVLGILAFLFFVGIIVFYGAIFIFKDIEAKGDKNTIEDGKNYWLLAAGVFIAFAAHSVGYFLTNSNMVLDFFWFFLAACFVGLIFKNKEFNLSPSSFLTLGVTFVFTLFFIFGFGLLILDGQRYLAEINYFQGRTAFANNESDKAISSLEKAVSLNQKSGFYLSELSQAYLSKIQSEIDRKDIKDQEKKQRVQFLVNNSINASKASTDLDANNVSYWSLRGYIYQNLSNLVEGADDWSIASYEKAMELDPVNPYYPTQKGIALLIKSSKLSEEKKADKEKLLEDAKVEFNKAIALKSDYSSARFQLAMAYQEQGKTDQAFKTLEETKKYAPNDVGLAFQIGLLYYNKKDYKNAQLELERAITINPLYSNGLYFLGLAYNYLGQKDKAIEKMSKVLELNPDNDQIKKILENMKSDKDPLLGISSENPPQEPIKEQAPEKVKNK